jgi:lambda family phage portal protein
MFEFIKKIFKQKSHRRGYDASIVNRLFPAMSKTDDPNSDIKQSISSIRDQARNLEVNTDIAKRAINLIIINVIGRGISLIADGRKKNGEIDSNVNNDIEGEWTKFGKRGVCDTTGRLSWLGVLRLVATYLFRDGEAFVRHVIGWPHNEFGYAIQVLEPDLVDEELNLKAVDGSKNKVIMGVELDEWDRAVAYFFKSNASDSDSKLYNGKYYKRIPAGEITHIFDPSRVSAVRGVSAFSAVTKRIRNIDKYEEAEIINARVSASRMGFYKKTVAENEEYDGDDSEDTGEKKKGVSFLQEARPGHFSVIPEGYEFQSWDPNSPNDNFAEFRKSQLRSVAAGLSVGFSELAQDFQNVNYTSLRAAALTDRDGYEQYQNIIVDSLCSDVYKHWFKAAFLKNRFKFVTVDNYDACLDPKWQPRRWRWVDPYKEGMSFVMLNGSGLLSEKEILAERGAELQDVYLQLAEAQKLRDKLGLTFENGGASASNAKARKQV